MNANCIVEDGYDFWKELSAPDTDTDEEHVDTCLLSKDPLIDNYITLPCKHKFNYLPICNEMAHLKNPHANYARTINLQRNQICCPYCRQVFDKLLPHIPGKDIKIPEGVCSKRTFIDHRTCKAVNKKGVVCSDHRAFDSEHGTLCAKHTAECAEKHTANLDINIEQRLLYTKHTIAQLKVLLHTAGKKVSGNKTQLICRLLA